ncbi:ThiF family adenylyltransferase [Bacillus multifaciens]|uniref:ThiF family adenylyltransferase n=1 Tax=Bacillus multifaciens TaxID=3068506 RepID=UPI00274111B3|nr:ThiF family adenylyltransferase [Bacillus sp. WLY-B-L8]MDP7978742.1 ThiF family adenylyltransferase [Bacillus sp. WLY-B-L8]HDX9591127.1 ThiF family adenylyltransferase [Bacillus pseudomycoides]
MLRFKEAVVIKHQTPYCSIYFGTNLFEIEDPDLCFFNLLSKREWEIEELSTELRDFLIDNSLVVKPYNIENIDAKLVKNIHFFENKQPNFGSDPVNIQKNICQKKVIILGCGGIGTVVLKNLISFGVKHFLIIEFDNVEESNLNRQLFFDANHIGCNKGSIIKEIISRFDKDIEINTINIRVNKVEDLQSACNDYDADFFVNCADTPKCINDIVYEYCKARSIPFIQGAVGIETGYWGPIFKGNFINTILLDTEHREPVMGSISSTNMTIGALISNDILEFWINDKQENLYRRKSLNFRDYTIEFMEN